MNKTKKLTAIIVTVVLATCAAIIAYFIITPRMANENLILKNGALQEMVKKANKNDCSAIDSLIWHYSSIGDKKNEQKWEDVWKRSGCKYGVKY